MGQICYHELDEMDKCLRCDAQLALVQTFSTPPLQEQIAQAIEALLEKVEALENYEPNIRISRNSQLYGVGFMECIKQVSNLIKETAEIARNYGKEGE